MGIIETLSAGFDTVRRRPWLVLVPIILDVSLRIAPKLSVMSLMRGVLALLKVQAAAAPELLPTLQESTQMLEQMARGINLSSLVSSSYVGVPSLPAGGAASFFGWTRPVIEVSGGLGLVGLVVGLSLVGLLIGALYLGLIAQEVRDGHLDGGRLARCLGLYWLRLTGAFLLIFAGLVFLGLPLAIVMGVLGLLSESLASLVAAIVSFGIVWVLIYMAFVPEAILVGEVGVVRAIWNSVNIVRVALWPTLGILVIVNIIGAGLSFVWPLLTANSGGMLVAIVGNAYVGTGLTAALFIFYRERYRAWQAAIAARNLPPAPVV